ncbi:response regulator transcription factor [Pseudomonas khavaziana]|uniref:response regulator transcription factor n=1 Tax=Pseudomonas khavaziana TaxID=2842351 RepID=UPI001C3C3FF4|nr:response regulator transcription factor [Pseudomonas khavaziana]MBV4482658.1 response regulator transcription factor [Pseudomonas khavaziana]
MHKVLVVDDHPFMRAIVVMILGQENFDVVGEANNGVDALQLIKQHEPDLVVLDIAIPKLDGLEVIRRIKKLKLRTKILVLTSQPTTLYANRCRLAGAAGYISKVDELNELRKALATVMSGYSVFPVLEHDSVNRADQDASDEHLISRLSARELAVLQHLARGMSNLEIGNRMLLSNKTISAHKKRLLDKLNVTSQVALAEFAKRNSII